MNRLTAAHIALVHLEAACDHLQALHDLDLPETVKSAAILAQKVNGGIADDVRKAGGIKDERGVIRLASTADALRGKPRASHGHHATR